MSSSKTTKKANAAVAQKSRAEQLETRRRKDDGTRWTVVRDGHPVYVSDGGVTRGEAERLAEGLLGPATIVQVTDEDEDVHAGSGETSPEA